jgi:hypothetical protein
MGADFFDVTFPQTPGGQSKEQVLAATKLLREETTERTKDAPTEGVAAAHT